MSSSGRLRIVGETDIIISSPSNGQCRKRTRPSKRRHRLPTFRHLAHLAEMKRLVRIEWFGYAREGYLCEETRSDEGTVLHSGVKWGKLITALEPNTPYSIASLKKILQDRAIYTREEDIKDFLYNARLSGVLWFRPVRYHNSSIGEVLDGKSFYLDLTNPKVQVYLTIRDEQNFQPASVVGMAPPQD